MNECNNYFVHLNCTWNYESVTLIAANQQTYKDKRAAKNPATASNHSIMTCLKSYCGPQIFLHQIAKAST